MIGLNGRIHNMDLSPEELKKLEELKAQQQGMEFPLPYGGAQGELLQRLIEASAPKEEVRTPAEVDNEQKQQELPLLQKIKNLSPTKKLNPIIDNTPTSKEVLSGNINKLLQKEPDEFEDAKKARNDLQLASLLGKASATIGGSIAGVKPMTEGYEQLFQLANQPISDLSTKQQLKQAGLKTSEMSEEVKNQLTKGDPNSDISKIGRDIAKHAAKTAGLSVVIPDNISMTNLEKLMPGIENMANRKMLAESQLLGKKESREAKKQQEVEKMATNMGKDLDPTGFRAGTLRDNQKRIDAAGRVDALFEATGGNPNSINMRELGTTVAGMLSNGSSTAVSQINELVPHTMSGSASKIQEWLTSNPTGAGQQKFAQMYKEIAEREKEIAQNQIIQAQFKKAYGTHKKLKESSPDDFYNTLSTQTGLSIDDIKAMEAEPGFKGNYKVPEKMSKEDEEAVKWAKEHKDDPRAQQILQMHGM